ncbi:MAG: hypothetical protein ACK40L_02645 [Hydrogenophaga sp.]|jgi:hypothetical protein|nr:hypothetical protein [Hydrogenophaga sp.]
MSQGAIGNWSLGIGDPTWGGWTTVALYALAAWSCWRLLASRDETALPLPRDERWVWRAMLAAMVALGVNKQLDLQSAFTELGRIAADRQGWYAERQRVQLAFVAGLAIVGLTLLVALLYLAWGAPAPTLWAIAGAVGLAIFVMIRAASLHRVDLLLGHSLAGLRINWLLEMGALLVIVGSAWRRRQVA